MATPKQIAYLKYLGVRRAKALSKDAASQRIEELHARAESDRRLAKKIDRWPEVRSRLHPKLYPPGAFGDLSEVIGELGELPPWISRATAWGNRLHFWGSRVQRWGCGGCLLRAAAVAVTLVVGALALVNLFRGREEPEPKTSSPARQTVDMAAPAVAVETVPERKPDPELSDSVPPKPVPKLPSEMRTMRSADGREMKGQVIARDPVAKTVAIRRVDGIVFRDFPVERLSPEDRAWVETLPGGDGKP